MKNKWFKLGGAAALMAVMAVMVFGGAASAQGPWSNPNNRTAPVTTTAVVPLTAAESAGLTYMVEEEKLARDVYLTLYAQYQAPVFNNIASSEAQHMAALQNLLARYGIADPTAGNAIGEFENPALQALYDQLVAWGSQSLASAYQVGITIEKVDIDDLNAHLAETTKTDIQAVFNNLLRGSNNHLRAFTYYAAQ